MHKIGNPFSNLEFQLPPLHHLLLSSLFPSRFSLFLSFSLSTAPPPPRFRHRSRRRGSAIAAQLLLRHRFPLSLLFLFITPTHIHEHTHAFPFISHFRSSKTGPAAPSLCRARRRVSPAAVAGLGQQGRSGCGVAAAGASLAAGASRGQWRRRKGSGVLNVRTLKAKSLF